MGRLGQIPYVVGDSTITSLVPPDVFGADAFGAFDFVADALDFFAEFVLAIKKYMPLIYILSYPLLITRRPTRLGFFCKRIMIFFTYATNV
jgi:hypothetical protein